MNRISQIDKLLFIDTYYLANIAEAVVGEESFGYVRFFDEIWSEGKVLNYSCGFSKECSALECFIFELCDRVYEELTCEISASDYRKKKASFGAANLKIDSILHKYTDYIGNFEDHLKLKPNLEPSDYYLDVYEHLVEAYKKVSYEVFHILFMNRAFLQKFNQLLADNLELFSTDEDIQLYDVFKKNGTLKRVAIPSFVKKAVFYRDRGRCVYCNKDLSNLISVLSKGNFDHIIPLAKFGANDISNLQLCCSGCNGQKREKIIEPSHSYERWY